MLFPFEKARDIQKEFMKLVDQALNTKKNLLVHAPTGIGKTAAALSPTLTFALEKKYNILFLTSRQTQHRLAIETLKAIKNRHHVNVQVTDLIGKRMMCAQSGVNELNTSEFYEYCKDLREKNECIYYSNLKQGSKLSVKAQYALKEMKTIGVVPVEVSNSISKMNDLCPFEMSCIHGKESQVIIADYYHLLHPSIRESILKRMNKNLSNTIVIFDEAHNLPERARKLLTSNLTTYIISKAVKEAEMLGAEPIVLNLNRLKNILKEIAEVYLGDYKTEEILIKKEDLRDKIEPAMNYRELIEDLTALSEIILEKKKRSYLNSVATFLDSWLGPDEGFVRILSWSKNKKGELVFNLIYKCLDPSLVFRPIIDLASSIVAMSGTLTPLEMYRDLFGFRKDEVILAEFNNPFPQENRLNLIIPETSTKYTSRTNKMYELIADKCSQLINSIPGNIAIFFPSYYLLEKVNETLSQKSSKTIFVEDSRLNKNEREEMINRFKSYKEVGAVLLGVSAGSFGEGIDLIGDYLKAVVIVGLPLTKPDLETQELIKYYDKKFGKGWDYGYIYPAMIKIMQNAGRCIRSSTDRGVIIFLDERYLWKNYFKCFPKDWQMKVSVKPIEMINQFFSED